MLTGLSPENSLLTHVIFMIRYVCAFMMHTIHNIAPVFIHTIDLCSKAFCLFVIAHYRSIQQFRFYSTHEMATRSELFLSTQSLQVTPMVFPNPFLFFIYNLISSLSQ